MRNINVYTAWTEKEHRVLRMVDDKAYGGLTSVGIAPQYHHRVLPEYMTCVLLLSRCSKQAFRVFLHRKIYLGL